ncbi:MAG: ATP-binding protein [Chitinophagales bacterium]|nr:ATP-binding protein [Chitinophagales bacterium]MDW8417871.1 ATP-binding protein [Chitinophagales bacterium]
MEHPKTILLLDADEQSAGDIQRFLKASAYAFSVSHVSAPDDALNFLRFRQPDLILLDASLTGAPGFSELRSTVERQKIPVILLSGMQTEEARAIARTAGAVEYIIKNKINLFHLQKTIAGVLRLTEAENRLDETFHDFAAQHESFYAIINRLQQGVLVLNSHNAVRYANTYMHGLLSDDTLKKRLTEILVYRELLTESEKITLQADERWSLHITVSPIQWNGEPCNVFVVDYRELPSTPPAILDKHVQSLLHHLNENVVLLQGDKVVFANRPAQELLKLNQRQLTSVSPSTLFEINNESPASVNIQHLLAEKKSEGSIRLPDGATVRVLFRILPIHIDGAYHQLITFTPLQNPADAGVPNLRTDSEKFSTDDVLHIASHDLREPVRTILNYVQLLSDKLSAKKYTEAMEYAAYARQSAERMERLLSDLKTYIGLNTYVPQLTKVSMKQALSDVLQQLKPQLDAANAEVSHAELPDVTADKELVEKLLFSLIENALKFRKKDRRPVIDIGFDKFEGNIIFCVRDNGIGISKKYYQRIFHIFERLNRVDEYPGNGIGLAICKKITDMHGGEIWVESLPGSGSNFYFTLKGK